MSDTRENVIALHASGKKAKDIALELGVSRVTVYKYIQATDAKSTESRIGADAGMGESFEMEMLRIELDATKRQLELYKKETARLMAMLES